MTPELDPLLARLEPATDSNRLPRLKFGLLCARRVEALLEQAEVVACLRAFEQEMAQAPRLSSERLDALSATARELANRHQGSRSLDGVGHAAVSATYACANAMSGRARQAAQYAAYAAVYGQGGYGATSDPASFLPEYAWQARELAALLG